MARGRQTEMQNDERGRMRMLCRACVTGEIEGVLRQYLAICEMQSMRSVSGTSERAKCKRMMRLPNLFGFCRYLGISLEAYGRLRRLYPEVMGRIQAVLEDEALNSDLSPTLLMQYLKYLHEGKESLKEEKGGRERPMIKVSFAHDILEDGK